MHAEIIAIGDEITSGQLLDTNSQWLSLRLEEMGIRVLYHATVGDDLEALAGVFRQAVARSDVVISTGGLGPTADDLTREALAQGTGRRLLLDQKALAHIRELFARRGREMPERNELQAMFPEGARPVPNPHGTAPGIAMEIARAGKPPCRLFALPGVPPEMREMWTQSVSVALREAGAGHRLVRHRIIKCFGAGESTIEEMLPDLIRRGRVPRVGINASKTTIILRITADGADEKECQALIEPTAKTIYQCLGNLAYGEGDDELQDALARLLQEQDKTLATCEWGTGGMVADWLGDVPEAREHYLGGVVVSGETGLVRAAGVPEELVRQQSAASPEVAQAMAHETRRRFGTDYGLAVSRFPDPNPLAAEPLPFYLGLADAEGVRSKAVPYAGHPATLKIYCAKHALNMARLALLEAGAS